MTALAQTLPLAAPMWPLWAAHGPAVLDRRTTLTITLPDGTAAARAAGLLSAVDALNVRLRQLPSVRVPVLYADDGSGPDAGEAAAAITVVGAGQRTVDVSVPSALVDVESVRLLAELAAARAGEPAVGLLDVVDWTQQRLERDAPGALDAGFRTLVDLHGGHGSRGEYAQWPMSAELASALAAAGRAHGAAVEDVLTAALLVVRRAVDGDRMAAVHRVLSGRSVPELADVVGRLDLLAPVQVDVTGGMDLAALVAEVAASVQVATAEYGRDPLPAVRSALATLRPGEPASIGVVGDPVPAGSAGLTVAGADPGPCDALFSCGPTMVRLRYRPEVLSPGDLDRLDGRLVEVLRQAAGDPHRRVRSVTVVGPAERSWQQARLNVGGHTRGPEATVPHDIAERAARDSRAVAVHDGERQLDYGQLCAAAVALAQALAGAGFGAEDVIAVGTGSLADFVVASLGVMAAGCAFLPLDPAIPARRAAQLLASASVRGVVAAPDAAPEVRRIELPEAGPENGDAAVAELAGLVRSLPPAGLAYVIHTSGTAGGPKPVAVEHRQLAAYSRSAARAFGITAGSVGATPATLSADLGYTAVFPTLASGGTVVAIPSAARLDPAAVAEITSGHRVDVLKISPAHLGALFDAVDGGSRVLPARLLVSGGEQLPAELLARVREARPDLAVANHYGPTETTVGALYWMAGEPDGGDVPIGHPFSHVFAEIRTADGDLAPVGTRGGLFVGGAGVARGYLGDPRLTAARFVPALAGPPGARVYDTGDRCRCPDDGQVRFCGRDDDLVKIRGHRVAPEEVRAALLAGPAVRQAAVVADERRSGTELVACVVAADDRADPDELRDFLRDRLPEAIVPARIVLAPALPLTANGKVDRAAVITLAERAAPGRDPEGPVERILVEIWTELMDGVRINATEDLFAAGANSLTVTRALSRLREAFDVELPIEAFFEHRTVERFACHLLDRTDRALIERRASVLARLLAMSDEDVDALVETAEVTR